MILLLAKVLLMIGAAILATMVIKLVLLTIKNLLLKVRDKIRASAGRRVFISRISKLAKEVTAEAERTGNVHKVDDLLAELGEDGVVLASVDADNEVKSDEIEVLSAEKMDAQLNNLLSKNQGEIVFA
ncbi:MAG: hypothetical protein IKI84_09460 [Clostridia bacterium]|nr:hypothetical protein [Clostridia bacterium]